MVRPTRFARLVTMFVLLFTMSLGGFAAQAQSPASGAGTGLGGRYLVALSESTEGEDAAAIAETLAATYGGRLEPFARDGFRGFIVIARESSARLLRADARVASVQELTGLDGVAAAPLVPAATTTSSAVPSVVQSVVQSSASIAAAPRTEWTFGYAMWSSGSYQYDAGGNVTSIGDDVYSYDRAGRLLTATANTTAYRNAQAFTYDRYGNLRTTTTVVTHRPTETSTSTVATNDVSAATNHLTGSAYDDAGNLRALSGTELSYEWDDLGVMTVFSEGDTLRRYVYDASDERVVIASGTQRRFTLRDAGNAVVRDFFTDRATATWRVERDYVYRGSTMIAAFTDGRDAGIAQRHFHVDHLGSPRLITDAASYAVEFQTYLPFGGPARGTDLDGERLKFTGHERDFAYTAGADLDYMHARYYTANVGRFLSMDRVMGDPKKPASWNRYAYASNNPLTRIDPDGNADVGTVGRAVGESQLSPGRHFIAFLCGLANDDGRMAGHAAVNMVIDGALELMPLGTGGLLSPLIPRPDEGGRDVRSSTYQAALAIARTEDFSSGGKPIVLWSGDAQAVQARRLANDIGGVTLADTTGGQRLKNMDLSSLSWGEQRSIWVAASAAFVLQSTGDVHVLSPTARTSSIQSDVERPLADPARIIYHNGY